MMAGTQPISQAYGQKLWKIVGGNPGIGIDERAMILTSWFVIRCQGGACMHCSKVVFEMRNYETNDICDDFPTEYVLDRL